MNSKNFITVICPIYNESGYIIKCIESIIAQDYPIDLMEILFVDGMSIDNTREIVKGFTERFTFIKLLDNPDKIVSNALNIGIKAAVGDIIIRIDAHCEYPTNYFSTLVDNLNKLNADNVGGVIHTKPANSSAIAKAISIALRHPFGVGNSFFRIGSKKIKEVDTVPFGCFRRTLFDRIGFFDTELVRNQDDEFNGRIIKNGGKIYLIPKIEIFYYARKSLSKISQMFYQYGLYKPLVGMKLGAAATLRQFIPLLFVFGIILSVLISLIFNPEAYITISIISLYCLLSFVFSTIESIRQRSLINLLLLPIVFFVIHISYGWGYLIGIFQFFILGKKSILSSENR